MFFHLRPKLKNRPLLFLGALSLSIATAVLGYVMLGLLPMLIFSVGFLGGFILWLIVPSKATFSSLKFPYFLSLILFAVHKYEERKMDFFPALSTITGVPVPDTSSPLVYLLYSAACFWLLIPWLIKRESEFGYYLGWTFFTSMGIVELAHFIFPLLLDDGYSYFPGMASVLFLAPAAWWGLWRMCSATMERTTC